MNVTVLLELLYEMVPVTAPARGCSSAAEADCADCTASLNVAVTGDDTATPVAPLVGDSVVTVGGAASVVNDQVTGAAIGSPAVSLAPLTVAVKTVPYARAALGVKVAV